jgi:hypothetical protein
MGVYGAGQSPRWTAGENRFPAAIAVREENRENALYNVLNRMSDTVNRPLCNVPSRMSETMSTLWATCPVRCQTLWTSFVQRAW